jgi:hypothetical protein
MLGIRNGERNGADDIVFKLGSLSNTIYMETILNSKFIDWSENSI